MKWRPIAGLLGDLHIYLCSWGAQCNIPPEISKQTKAAGLMATVEKQLRSPLITVKEWVSGIRHGIPRKVWSWSHFLKGLEGGLRGNGTPAGYKVDWEGFRKSQPKGKQSLWWRVDTFSLKGQMVNILTPGGSSSLYCNYSTLRLLHKHSHGHYVNEWARLCSINTSFTKPGNEWDVAHLSYIACQPLVWDKKIKSNQMQSEGLAGEPTKNLWIFPWSGPF